MSAFYTWCDFLGDCLELSSSNQPPSEILTGLDSKLSLLHSDPTLRSLFKELSLLPTVDYRTNVVLHTSYCKVMLIYFFEGGVIGLHNHPEQHGYIYCLEGRTRIQSFDENSSSNNSSIFSKVDDSILVPYQHARFTPTVGNIHSLEALSTSHLVDIFIPPLQDENRSKCRRYRMIGLIPDTDIYAAKILQPPESGSENV